MENKTAEKAKKGALSIVFSRTALILLLVVVQFLLMLGIATYLRDYVVYVYSAMNILGAVIVICLLYTSLLNSQSVNTEAIRAER